MGNTCSCLDVKNTYNQLVSHIRSWNGSSTEKMDNNIEMLNKLSYTSLPCLEQLYFCFKVKRIFDDSTIEIIFINNNKPEVRNVTICDPFHRKIQCTVEELSKIFEQSSMLGRLHVMKDQGYMLLGWIDLPLVPLAYSTPYVSLIEYLESWRQEQNLEEIGEINDDEIIDKNVDSFFINREDKISDEEVVKIHPYKLNIHKKIAETTYMTESKVIMDVKNDEKVIDLVFDNEQKHEDKLPVTDKEYKQHCPSKFILNTSVKTKIPVLARPETLVLPPVSPRIPLEMNDQDILGQKQAIESAINKVMDIKDKGDIETKESPKEGKGNIEKFELIESRFSEENNILPTHPVQPEEENMP